MPDSTPANILIVDDDLALLRLLERTLKCEGFATTTASSGREAIAWLAKNNADLMLLDLKLQDIEGKELINHLANIGRPVPFIIITGQGDERVAVEMMKRGALDYLVKDLQFIEFVPIVVRRALTEIEKEKRLAFAEKQARLTQTVVEQSYSAVMIISKDGKNEIIRYVNPAFLKLTNCSAEKLIGNRLSDMETLVGPWEWFRRQLSAGVPFIGELQLCCCSQGRQLIVDCTVTEVLDLSGVQTHWVIILRDMTERKQLEREILEISDREQSRIGRDLHDGLGQQLTALEFFTTGLKDEVQAQAPKLVKPLEKISRQLREAIRQVRRMAHGLSPVSLHGDGLASALRKLAGDSCAMAGVDCKFKCDAPVEVQDPVTATQFYRIAQEAMNNALKHGRPKTIHVSLKREKGLLELKVSDDGRGFSLAAPKGGGMGMHAMKYRAGLIGASLDIDSAPRKGTRVTCTIFKPQ